MHLVCSAIRSPFTHCRSIDSEAIMLTEQCLFHSQLSGHGTQKEFRIEQLSILDHVATHLLTATSLSFCPSYISVIVVCRSLYSSRCALFIDCFFFLSFFVSFFLSVFLSFVISLFLPFFLYFFICVFPHSFVLSFFFSLYFFHYFFLSFFHSSFLSFFFSYFFISYFLYLFLSSFRSFLISLSRYFLVWS